MTDLNAVNNNNGEPVPQVPRIQPDELAAQAERIAAAAPLMLPPHPAPHPAHAPWVVLAPGALPALPRPAILYAGARLRDDREVVLAAVRRRD